MHALRWAVTVGGLCALLGGCQGTQSSSSIGQPSSTGSVPAAKGEQDREYLAQKRWSSSIHMSYNLLRGKEQEFEILQGANSLSVIGITDDEMPIVTASFGDLLDKFYLEIYLTPKTTLKGVLSYNNGLGGERTYRSFTNVFWRDERKWKVVAGDVPPQEEWYWSGTYRTDGETLYFDAVNENGSHCTWMLVTPTPRKSRKE